MAKRLTTRVSTKGQVILPKIIRERRQWAAGTELVVEETEDGVLLKQEERIFPETKPEDVFGCLNYQGPPISVEDMNRAVEREKRRRYARD